MKKILIILSFIIIILLCNTRSEKIIIPNESIRLRVISNSSKVEDQIIKNRLSIDLNTYIQELLINSNNYNESNELLLNNYNNLYEFIKNKLNNDNFSLTIGKNMFPEKKYKGVIYKEGIYDSVVVRLGNSNGMNWWCVVYPPLCLIDEEKDNVEYTTIVKEILNSYNSK